MSGGVLSKLSFNDVCISVISVMNGDGDNTPYFFAREVAAMLGYRSPKDAVRAHCKGVISLSDLSDVKGGKLPPFAGGLNVQGPRHGVLIFEGLQPAY